MTKVKNMQAFKAGMLALLIGGALVWYGSGLSIPALGFVGLFGAVGCFMNAFNPRV